MEICLQLLEQVLNMGRQYRNLNVGDAHRNHHVQAVIRVETKFAPPKYWENCFTLFLVSLYLKEHWRILKTGFVDKSNIEKTRT